MNVNESHIEGWDAIAKLFPMITKQTLVKRYGKEMLEGGWVMRSNKGQSKRPVIWAWPSVIKQFQAKKMIDNKKV